MAYGCSNRDELGEMLTPVIATDVEPDADNTVGAEVVGFFLHPGHRELACVILDCETKKIDVAATTAAGAQPARISFQYS